MKKISHNEAQFLASAIDRAVKSIAFSGSLYELYFGDGGVLQNQISCGALIVVLAILANKSFRGIRKGLRELLTAVNDLEAGSIYFSVANGLVRVKLVRGDKESLIVMERFESQIAVNYEVEEFGRVTDHTITCFPPGRALAPLHSSAYRQRAKAIVSALDEKNPSALLSLRPMMVVLGITDYCNQKCPFCFRQVDPRYDMSQGDVFTDRNLTDVFCQLAEAGVQGVRLCGEGEDTIHPNYLKFILLARVAGMNILQITNGTTLHTFAPLMKRCIDVLRVSINGWTSEEYKRKHGIDSSDDFDRIIAGLKLWSNEKTPPGRNPTLCVSSVLTENDCSSYCPTDLRRLLDQIGADVMIIKRDLECSRSSTDLLPRLAIHEPLSRITNVRTDNSAIKNKRTLFESFFSKCRMACPRVFDGHQFDASLLEFPDWITRLGIGCVLRYIRVEIERLHVYNCSMLHEYYGNLRLTDFNDTWFSQARETGISNDLMRPSVLCPSCGWGDIFRLMNCFIGEQVDESRLAG
jgi:hypothetical protein